jgi:hypothetical protein
MYQLFIASDRSALSRFEILEGLGLPAIKYTNSYRGYEIQKGNFHNISSAARSLASLPFSRFECSSCRCKTERTGGQQLEMVLKNTLHPSMGGSKRG